MLHGTIFRAVPLAENAEFLARCAHAPPPCPPPPPPPPPPLSLPRLAWCLTSDLSPPAFVPSDLTAVSPQGPRRGREGGRGGGGGQVQGAEAPLLDDDDQREHRAQRPGRRGRSGGAAQEEEAAGQVCIQDPAAGWVTRACLLCAVSCKRSSVSDIVVVVVVIVVVVIVMAVG
eukprot:COSAG01_NODE_852_length_13108_cov_7.167423_14_plen_173_part_00